MAAKAGIWGPYEDYHRCNVEGRATCSRPAELMAYADSYISSSPSVVFDGRSQEGVDESVPYPSHFDSPYPATKAEAEPLGARGG